MTILLALLRTRMHGAVNDLISLPPIWLGGFTPATLRRAVRFGDGFTVPEANRDLYDRYVSELKKENRPTENLRFASGFWFFVVSNDPERTFAEAVRHVSYQVNNYPDWLTRR